MATAWFKFYPNDWKSDPNLRLCSLSARGLWLEMLCLMHEAEPYGFLRVNGIALDAEKLSMLVGAPLKQVKSALAELHDAAVFSEDERGIYSRKMVRDSEKEGHYRQWGKDGGNPNLKRGTVPKSERIRGFRRSDAPVKTKRIFDRNDGKCNWCGVDLVWTIADETCGNLFHVDHVIAIRDGGTNDEDNLVAACRKCNHERARVSDGDASDVNVGMSSDHKLSRTRDPEARSQKPEKKELRSSARADDPLSSDFAEWYAKYPRKVAKARAEKAYRVARKQVDAKTLLDGLDRYLSQKPDYQDWKHPTTWLSGRCWEDDYGDAKPPPSKPNPDDVIRAKVSARKRGQYYPLTPAEQERAKELGLEAA